MELGRVLRDGLGLVPAWCQANFATGVCTSGVLLAGGRPGVCTRGRAILPGLWRAATNCLGRDLPLHEDCQSGSSVAPDSNRHVPNCFFSTLDSLWQELEQLELRPVAPVAPEPEPSIVSTPKHLSLEQVQANLLAKVMKSDARLISFADLRKAGTHKSEGDKRKQMTNAQVIESLDDVVKAGRGRITHIQPTPAASGARRKHCPTTYFYKEFTLADVEHLTAALDDEDDITAHTALAKFENFLMDLNCGIIGTEELFKQTDFEDHVQILDGVCYCQKPHEHVEKMEHVTDTTHSNCSKPATKPRAETVDSGTEAETYADGLYDEADNCADGDSKIATSAAETPSKKRKVVKLSAAALARLG